MQAGTKLQSYKATNKHRDRESEGGRGRQKEIEARRDRDTYRDGNIKTETERD